MNKKISLGAAIAYMAIVAAVAFSLTMIYSMNLFNVKMTGITEREKMYSSLHEVDLYVRENYYGSINEEELQEEENERDAAEQDDVVWRPQQKEARR